MKLNSRLNNELLLELWGRLSDVDSRLSSNIKNSTSVVGIKSKLLGMLYLSVHDMATVDMAKKMDKLNVAKKG